MWGRSLYRLCFHMEGPKDKVSAHERKILHTYHPPQRWPCKTTTVNVTEVFKTSFLEKDTAASLSANRMNDPALLV